MRIAEIYPSVQGEGLLTGTPSVFVRASGCNLRCQFCDTPYTSWAPEGHDLPVGEIVRRVLEHEHPHVVITGGEPMMYSDLLPLTRQLADAGRHLTIETAGTLFLPVTCHLMSISPKLSNSTPSRERAGAWRERHERSRHAPEVILELTTHYGFQLKFVIDTEADCVEVGRYLLDFPSLDRSRVWLMPQGTDPGQLAATASWLEPYCRERGLRYCPRRHIEWFGYSRGT